MSNSSHPPHEHEDHHLPISHNNDYDLCRIEYREIDTETAEYTLIGDHAFSGKVGEAMASVKKVQQSGFPPKVDANAGSNSPFPNSSKLSINFNDDACLYVFKLSDDSKLIFDQKNHGFQAHLPDGDGHQIRERIKEIFSDGTVIGPQWACFVFNGKIARSAINQDKLRLAFHFHVTDKVAGLAPLPHPPYWPPHPPDMY